jgi:hypothetical protein
MFPEVEGRFSEEQLEDLGQSLEAAKKSLGRRLARRPLHQGDRDERRPPAGPGALRFEDV